MNYYIALVISMQQQIMLCLHMLNTDFSPKLHRDARRFRYLVLLGVAHADLIGNEVTGTFRKALEERYGTPDERLVEQFVNWPRDRLSVQRFVLQYGPVNANIAPEGPFRCSVGRFEAIQDALRIIWRNRDDFLDWPIRETTLQVDERYVTHHAHTLESFLYIDLLTCPIDRLKVCKREGCEHPYFLTGDLKRRFCTVECSDVGRRQTFKDWRADRKGSQGKTSEAAKKGASHGTE